MTQEKQNKLLIKCEELKQKLEVVDTSVSKYTVENNTCDILKSKNKWIENTKDEIVSDTDYIIRRIESIEVDEA